VNFEVRREKREEEERRGRQQQIFASTATRAASYGMRLHDASNTIVKVGVPLLDNVSSII
jgi:hypothetical protein